MVQVGLAHLVVLLQGLGQGVGVDTHLLGQLLDGVGLKVAVIAGLLGVLHAVLEGVEALLGVDDVEDVGTVLGIGT